MLSRLCEGSCELVATELKRLKIDRVDLVPEGANSAAFVTLYKGKEMKSMDVDAIINALKPEHAEVIKSAFADLTKAKEAAEQEVAETKKACDEAKKACDAAKKEAADAKAEAEEAKKDASGTTSFDEDETLTKGLDPEVAAFVSKLKKQKEAAEQVAKDAIAKERHAAAISKAAELKALPVATNDLVAFIEKSDDATVDMLSAINKGIESTVLSETGVNTNQSFAKSSSGAWQKIEKAAESMASEQGISVSKAVGAVIKQNPELYKEYLEGGAN